MKKLSIILILLTFVACQKENLSTGGQDSSDVTEEIWSCCDSLELVYHQRVEPGDFTFGNVEYWECPACGKCYSGLDRKDEISASIFLFPTQYQAASAAIAGNPWFSGSQDNSAVAGIFTAITIAYTIYSSIAGIYRASLVDFSALNRQLDEIFNKVQGISTQLNDLAKAVRVIPDQKMILERSEDIASLSVITEMTRMSIDSIKTLYPSLSTADTMKLKEEVIKIYNDWGNFEVGRQHSRPYELTEYLLSNYFSAISVDYHTMYRNFVNSLCTWEHEGFEIREAAMSQDLKTLSLSYCFTRTYYEHVRAFATPTDRAIAIKDLDSMYKKYYDSVKSSHDKDSVINANYRVLLKTPPSSGTSQVTYEKYITGPYNFYSQFKDHRSEYYFDYTNEKNRGVNSCNKLLDYMAKDQNFRCTDLMTQDEARLLVQIYNSSKHDKSTFAGILIDDCKFASKNLSDFRASTAHVIPERNNGHQRPRSESSSYKIFEWTSYRTGKSDHVGVYAVGSWDNNVETYYKFAKDCHIVRSDGEVKNAGSDPGDRFYTVRRVKSVKSLQ